MSETHGQIISKRAKKLGDFAESFGQYCQESGRDLSTMDDREIESFLKDLTRAFRRKHNRYVTNIELCEALGCYPETRVVIENEEDGSYMDVTPEQIGYMRVDLNSDDTEDWRQGPHVSDNGGELVLVISRKRINNNPPKPLH